MVTISQQLAALLYEAGLSEVDVSLYNELLKRPAQTVWELVLRTGYKKTAIYDSFHVLQENRMIVRDHRGIRSDTLKTFISKLENSRRKVGKLSNKIRQLAPFLHNPIEMLDVVEMYYTRDEIIEAYLMMAELDYSVNLDFGDYESFIASIGDNSLGFKFREKRVKHAKHHGICTTYGENLAEFCNKKDLERFDNQFDILPASFLKKRWIIFSDSSDNVLYNDASDPDFPVSTLVRSSLIADMERSRFEYFSGVFQNMH